MKQKKERQTGFPDYSHPSYYFRLFHEGRPKPRVFDFNPDLHMPKYVIQELGGSGGTKLKKPWGVDRGLMTNLTPPRFVFKKGEWVKVEMTHESTLAVNPEYVPTSVEEQKPFTLPVDDLFHSTPAGAPDTSADPLADIW